MEIFKEIEGFGGVYQISNYGRIKTTIRQGCSVDFLKPYMTPKGYLSVDLRIRGKRVSKRIHRLVAEAFIPNPQTLPEINHKDEDKTNNHVDNLEWCTHDYNIHYGTGTKRAIEKLKKRVLQYDFNGKLIKEWPSVKDAARALDIDSACVFRACNGIKAKTFHKSIWIYSDNPRKDEILRERLHWVLSGNNKRYGKKLRVKQYSLDGQFIREYESLRSAERDTGISACRISNSIRKGCCTDGYTWETT